MSMMDWGEELRQLRVEADSLRLERRRHIQIEEAERQQRLQQIKETFEGLQVAALLGEMDRQLLDGRGQVTLFLPWESGDQETSEIEQDEEDEELEDEEVASAILSWEEDGERELVVDVGMGERETYLRVNGADIRPRADALREALKRAFQEELEL